MTNKEIKAKTINASSIGSKRNKIKRAKRHSSKKLRQLLNKEEKINNSF